MPTKLNSSNNRRYLLNISVKKFIDDYVLRIDLDADYQREKIWSTKQQELLLDSLLIDIDIPKIYIVEVKNNEQFDYECIDGKQRMTALVRFFKPEPKEESPLKIEFLKQKYTYKELEFEHPSVAKKLEEYELSFSVNKPIEEDYIREMFRRLQFGIRLNSGELLKTRTGTIRDFIYNDIGNDGPFFRYTNLSVKRFSRPFTLAQICLNSFAINKADGEFVRARLQDIEDFFEEYQGLAKDDKNLTRIKNVLNEMDKSFGETSFTISSRAIAVSTYLFIEELYQKMKQNLIQEFSKFLVKFLEEIKYNMELLSNYEKPRNSDIMEEFQKYVLQASVEGYSIKRRHEYLKKAFDYYLDPETKGRIIGNR